MKYTITFDDGRKRSVYSKPCPARLPQQGDVYVTRIPFATLGASYQVGDRFAILGRTQDAPHHFLSSLGNLVILCKVMRSIWSEFDAAVATGEVELVQRASDEAATSAVARVLDSIRRRNRAPA